MWGLYHLRLVGVLCVFFSFHFLRAEEPKNCQPLPVAKKNPALSKRPATMLNNLNKGNISGVDYLKWYLNYYSDPQKLTERDAYKGDKGGVKIEKITLPKLIPARLKKEVVLEKEPIIEPTAPVLNTGKDPKNPNCCKFARKGPRFLVKKYVWQVFGYKYSYDFIKKLIDNKAIRTGGFSADFSSDMMKSALTTAGETAAGEGIGKIGGKAAGKIAGKAFLAFDLIKETAEFVSHSRKKLSTLPENDIYPLPGYKVGMLNTVSAYAIRLKGTKIVPDSVCLVKDDSWVKQTDSKTLGVYPCVFNRTMTKMARNGTGAARAYAQKICRDTGGPYPGGGGGPNPFPPFPNPKGVQAPFRIRVPRIVTGSGSLPLGTGKFKYPCQKQFFLKLYNKCSNKWGHYLEKQKQLVEKATKLNKIYDDYEYGQKRKKSDVMKFTAKKWKPLYKEFFNLNEELKRLLRDFKQCTFNAMLQARKKDCRKLRYATLGVGLLRITPISGNNPFDSENPLMGSSTTSTTSTTQTCSHAGPVGDSTSTDNFFFRVSDNACTMGTNFVVAPGFTVANHILNIFKSGASRTISSASAGWTLIAPTSAVTAPTTQDLIMRCTSCSGSPIYSGTLILNAPTTEIRNFVRQ